MDEGALALLGGADRVRDLGGVEVAFISRRITDGMQAPVRNGRERRVCRDVLSSQVK